jgi:sigma-B regulation protein RsbU (phosphoserine phosphatase)
MIHHDPHAKVQRRGLFSMFKSFNTKFILITGISIFIGAILNVVAARQGIHRLSEKSDREIEASLNRANREYLTNHLQDKARQTESALGHAYADLEILASVVQAMIDSNQDLEPVYAKMTEMALFRDKIAYNPKGNWYQNKPDEPTGVAVWGYLGRDGSLLPDTKKAVDSTVLLDLVLPAFKKYGADKLQIYYAGPKEYPYIRVAPFRDMGSNFDQLYPGHNQQNFYDYFFPGLVEGWLEWIKAPEGLKRRTTQITIAPLYEDAAGGGMVMTAFHPLWTKDRRGFAGTVALDLTLDQLIASIKDVKLAQTGFAFLTQAVGNVLAVNDAGALTLGLQADATKGGSGVGFLKRFLKDSKDQQVSGLKLPQDDSVDYHDITIAGKPHIIALQRLTPLNSLSDDKIIGTEYWTLGFVVPRSEMYASLLAAQGAIEQTRTNIVASQIIIAGTSFVMLMLGVYLVSRRLTGALVELSRGATRMRSGDYSVRVDVSSRDELGQLGVAFNDMANEIQAYTSNLEELVRARTKALEDANREIRELNSKLEEENLRLAVELNVARRLQLMVLPAEQELRDVPGLDIAGYMSPADEIGGDYYDVLRGTGLVKIGIGDVTGHGLESGVLMLMVQTAVRTLLASNESDPRRFLNIVNKVIYQNVKRINSEKNLTLSLIDYSDGLLKLTGQHEDVIIVRHDGRLERVDTTELGLPVGLDIDISAFISSVEIKLESGDVVTLFTDGVTEADNAGNRQYGIDRLCDVLVKNHAWKSEQIKDAVINDVMSHIGSNKIYDDITVLVIKRL